MQQFHLLNKTLRSIFTKLTHLTCNSPRLGREGNGAREGGGLALDGDEEVRAAGQHLRAHGASKRVKPPREAQSLVA